MGPPFIEMTGVQQDKLELIDCMKVKCNTTIATKILLHLEYI